MKKIAKSSKHSLLLSTEKVRELQPSDLRRVAGGCTEDSNTSNTSCYSTAPGAVGGDPTGARH
jgi:hypothetical protein